MEEEVDVKDNNIREDMYIKEEYIEKEIKKEEFDVKEELDEKVNERVNITTEKDSKVGVNLKEENIDKAVVKVKEEVDVKDNVEMKKEMYVKEEKEYIVEEFIVKEDTDKRKKRQITSEGVKRYKSVYCSMCQKPGHVMTDDCITCFSCGIKGHVRRDCPPRNNEVKDIKEVCPSSDKISKVSRKECLKSDSQKVGKECPKSRLNNTDEQVRCFSCKWCNRKFKDKQSLSQHYSYGVKCGRKFIRKLEYKSKDDEVRKVTKERSRSKNITRTDFSIENTSRRNSQTSSSIEIVLEFAHTAVLKDKPLVHKSGITHTHDWHLVVKAPEGGKCKYYLDKVVFVLNETDDNPMRSVNSPPFEIRESGYQSFTVPVDLYFKSQDKLFRKTHINFMVILQPVVPPYDCAYLREIKMRSRKTITIPDTVNKDFRRKLIKGGGKQVNFNFSPTTESSSYKKISRFVTDREPKRSCSRDRHDRDRNSRGRSRDQRDQPRSHSRENKRIFVIV